MVLLKPFDFLLGLICVIRTGTYSSNHIYPFAYDLLQRTSKVVHTAEQPTPTNFSTGLYITNYFEYPFLSKGTDP